MGKPRALRFLACGLLAVMAWLCALPALGQTAASQPGAPGAAPSRPAPMTSNQDVTDRLARLAAQARMPFIHDVPELAGEALAVYGPDFEDIYRRAGHDVARILEGERPAEMAIEEPRAFRLIVNARAARAIGLALSPALLLRADEVIQ